MGHLRTPQADSDLDEIWYYTAARSRSVEIADRLIDSITDRFFFLLASHPNIGRARDEDLRSGLRSFHVFKYVIIYRYPGRRRADSSRAAQQPEHRSPVRALGDAEQDTRADSVKPCSFQCACFQRRDAFETNGIPGKNCW